MAPKPPLNISGYSILPLALPPQASFPDSATHYLYLRPHEPRVPDPESSRSLFLVNVPITATETHLRHLFGTQLSAGRVERVEFHYAPTKRSAAVVGPQAKSNTQGNKKRKRVTSEDLRSELDSTNLPKVWDRELQTSGSHAVVVFVDRTSMETSLKAAKRAAKNQSKIIWGEDIEDKKLPSLGLQRYQNHSRLLYPSRSELLRNVNDYMTIFSHFEEVRAREAAQEAQEPDEDGFVKVTRGPKFSNPARDEEMKELAEKQKEKNKGLEDFYRFQMREKRKERQGELLKKFEEDKRKVEEMKKRRGKVRVCLMLFFPTDYILCD